MKIVKRNCSLNARFNFKSNYARTHTRTHRHQRSAWSCLFESRTNTSVCDTFACSPSLSLSLPYTHSLCLSTSLSVCMQYAMHTYIVCLFFFPLLLRCFKFFFYSLFILILVDEHDDITTTFSFVRSFCSWFLVTTQINRGQSRAKKPNSSFYMK